MPLKPITLSPSGPREVIDEAKAHAIVESWRSQLKTHKSNIANETDDDTVEPVLCDSLNLSDKSYTAASARIIADFITSSDETFPTPIATTLKYVDLHDVIASQEETVGLEVLQTFSKMLSSSKLIEVDLSDNAMGSKGVTACATILGGAPVIHSLERLSLCNNGLSRYTMDEVADLLTQENDGYCIAMNLTKLHFFNNMSGNEGCIAFERILNKCSEKLVDVRFSGTRAGSEGSKHITDALQDLSKGGKLKNLERLDLADNTFSEEVSYSGLANALKTCTELTYLNINDCSLGDEGIETVCQALLESKVCLQEFIIGGNEITASGAKYVAKVVKQCGKYLKKFSAEDNELTSRGVKRIVDSIASDCSIQTLVFNFCECGVIGGEAVLELGSRLNQGTYIHRLELNGNAYPEELVAKLKDTFGDGLMEMEDNDEEEDPDADLEEESESEEENEEDKDQDIDALAEELGKIGV